MACVPEIIAGTIPVGLNQRRVQNMHCVYSLQCFRSELHTVTTEYIRRDARVYGQAIELGALLRHRRESPARLADSTS